jgi:methylaspartate ammonia-lyase
MPDLGGIHNSVEAVLACQASGVGAFLGGSCAETDLSALHCFCPNGRTFLLE